jgi:putative ubiquitin-RnfH superfamily antitoxin RatB of RatAB toxin-antitoxin module
MSTVEVIYATLSKQEILVFNTKEGDTIINVINASGILQKFPEIDLTINKVGIYNQIKKLNDNVKAGDRVEIYRVLIADPKEVRRKKAREQKETGVIK